MRTTLAMILLGTSVTSCDAVRVPGYDRETEKVSPRAEAPNPPLENHLFCEEAGDGSYLVRITPKFREEVAKYGALEDQGNLTHMLTVRTRNPFGFLSYARPQVEGSPLMYMEEIFDSGVSDGGMVGSPGVRPVTYNIFCADRNQ